jgi:two-component system, LytTR family, sensor kinase
MTDQNLHRLRIALHIIASILFIVSPWFFEPPRHHGEPVGYYTSGTLTFIGTNILCVCFFYWNSLLLLPRFLLQEKRKMYWASLMASAIVFAVFMFLLGANMPPPPKSEGETFENIQNQPSIAHKPHFARPPHYRTPKGKILFMLFGAWSLSTLLTFARKWRALAQKQIEAEANQKTQELAALRAQINPHFLFNTLNNIYSLTQINPEAAGDAVLQLSDFMRYVVQEGDKNFIPLATETAYIQHFIALQRLRLNDLTTIDFKTSENMENADIPPLLLMPFIENAFAYGVSTRLASRILIEISVENVSIDEKTTDFAPSNHFTKQIILKVENPIIKTQTPQGSGIALKNTKRRLELLYPNRHTLIITETAEQYSVVLKLG